MGGAIEFKKFAGPDVPEGPDPDNEDLEATLVPEPAEPAKLFIMPKREEPANPAKEAMQPFLDVVEAGLVENFVILCQTKGKKTRVVSHLDEDLGGVWGFVDAIRHLQNEQAAKKLVGDSTNILA